jgi:hypothetical protein
MNPNGTWTLFMADLSNGGGPEQVISYELEITTVPEPVNLALGIFGAVALSVLLLRRVRKPVAIHH